MSTQASGTEHCFASLAYCSDFGFAGSRVRAASVISAGATNDRVGPFFMNGRPPFNASTTAPAVRRPPTLPTTRPLRFFRSAGGCSAPPGPAVVTCSDTAYPPPESQVQSKPEGLVSQRPTWDPRRGDWGITLQDGVCLFGD